MFFKQVFEEKLAQHAYVIGCQQTGEAIVIDPMRDTDRYKKIAEREGLPTSIFTPITFPVSGSSPSGG